MKAVEVLRKQDLLRKQADVIMNQVREIEARLEVSYGIYEAEMKFTPKIHEVYHLYEKNGTKILSFMAC